MKKILISILTILFLVSFVFIVGADELEISDEDDNDDINEINNRVCCRIYGLGSGMKQVNVRYGWIEESECITPEEFIGGGREIVEDEFCENNGLGIRIMNKTQIQKTTQIRNRLKIHEDMNECPNNCICAGSTIKCGLNEERQMTIMAGKSGNTIVQVKEANMSTNVTLYKSEDKIYGTFRNNQTREIKVLPDEVMEKIRERMRARFENQSIELDEDGIYRVEGKKKARLFLLIPVREKVRMQIDSETGELIKIRNPWWGFLARDIEDEEEEEETETEE